MKTRSGFVSNSSSSSFICDVCGENVTGYDISLTEAEMYQCEKGHTFCRSSCSDSAKSAEDIIEDIGKIELIKISIKRSIVLNEDRIKNVKKASDTKYWIDRVEQDKKILEELNDKDEDEIDELFDEQTESGGVMPSILCPICRFDVLDDSDVKRYLYKKYDETDINLKKEIKEKFTSYDDLQQFLKKDIIDKDNQ